MEIIKRIRRKRRRWINQYKWEKHKLSDWYHTYVSTRTQEYETALGFKLRTRGYIANRLMVDAGFEATEMKVLRKLIDQSDVFVDVGANIGYYTCLACTLGKPVVAFEPQPHNLACLLANIDINKWASQVEVFPVGLGDCPGILTLYGASGPSASLLKGWAGYSARHQQVIPINTLDNIICGRQQDRPLTIKIDVEGAEYHVLKGAAKTLARSTRPKWFLEICLAEFHPGSFNPRFEDTFKIFFDAGYKAFMADANQTPVSSNEVRTWVNNRSTGHPGFNYFFVHS